MQGSACQGILHLSQFSSGVIYLVVETVRPPWLLRTQQQDSGVRSPCKNQPTSLIVFSPKWKFKSARAQLLYFIRSLGNSSPDSLCYIEDEVF